MGLPDINLNKVNSLNKKNFGGACGNQTRDLGNANAALYQLS